MAKLRFEDGSQVRDFDTIVATLAPLGIILHRAPLADDRELRLLLDRPVLTSDEKARVLAALERQIEGLTVAQGGGCDLVALHPEMEGIDALLKKFKRCHTHPDDEVRYIVDGEGVFGVVLPDGSQAELTVACPDCVYVPKGMEHWFRLTESRRVKAVRIFMEEDHWEAEFTGTQVRM